MTHTKKNYQFTVEIPQNVEPDSDRLIDLKAAAELMGLQYYSLLTARSAGRLLLPIVRPSPAAVRVRLSDVMKVVRGEAAATGPCDSTSGRKEAIQTAKAAQLAEARAVRAAKKATKNNA